MIFLLFFWFLGSISHDIKKQKEHKEDRIKVSLKEMPKKVKKQTPIKKAIKTLKVVPPMPKGKQLKKIVKPLIKYKEKKVKKKIDSKPIVKKIKTKLEKPVIEPKTEPIPPVKPYIPLIQKNKENIDKYNSYDWLLDDKSAQENKKKKTVINSKNNIDNSNIKELYGDKFAELNDVQQKYILNNLEIMRRITQEILNRVAKINTIKKIDTNRYNLVEFYLHPNGDMTDFKFLKRSGYYNLDRTTQETIEYAYSRYPRPTQKILIIYKFYYIFK
jgi:outer membrane biosynthesis protein TonB